MPFNWFDIAVAILLLVGISRGRKRGMSEELLDVLKWLTIVVGSALAYRPLGNFISGYLNLGPLLSYVGAYGFAALSIHLIFSAVKKAVGEKLVHSDVFGKGEYYLGMLAGALRFCCMLIVALALLNADYISPAQLAAEAQMQQDNFGTITFPTIGSLQHDVFIQSASGPVIKRFLTDQLIVPTGPRILSSTPARREEKMLNEILGAQTH